MKEYKNVFSVFDFKKRKALKEQEALKKKQKEKAKRKSAIISLTTLFFLFLITGLIGSALDSNDSITTLSISSENFIIERNELSTLVFNTDGKILNNSSNEITCNSTDESVAAVINRNVYGLNVGEVSIQCTIKDIVSNTLTFKIIDSTSLQVDVDDSNTTVDPPISTPPISNPDPTPPVTTPNTDEQPNDYIPPSIPTSPNVTTNQVLLVSFLDVGQGDSILIQTPNKKYILIDAGTSSYGPSIENYLRSKGVSKIDVVIATHPHADHIGGMTHIINNFEIGSIYMPNVTSTTKTFENFLLAIQEKGLKINVAKAGVIIDIDSTLDIRLLAPVSSKYNDVNQHSAVLKVTYQSISFLFAGDAGQVSEQEMISSGVNLKADVLKVGHHGSKTSSTDSFLKAVSPKYAVISVGVSNRYGHPNQEVLDRLSQYGVETFRTDIHGTIVFTTDGTKLEINK